MKKIKVLQRLIGEETVQAVNARELHKYLESKRQFANWINDYLPDFELNADYLVFNKFVKNPTGGRPSVEYAISLDMAKHISLMSRTEKGKEIRKYFIECEKRLRSPDWSLERLVSKLGYKSMCDAIKASKENPATYDYSNNADLINRIILGMSAKQYKELNELGRKDAIRDKLEAHIIFAYSRLQFENERLIIEGVDFQARKDKLKALYAWLSQGLLPKTEKKPKLHLIVNNEV